MNIFLNLLYFELLIFFRRPQEISLGILFLILAASLFAFIVSKQLMHGFPSLSLSMLWVLIVLTQGFMTVGIFQRDLEDGTFEGLQVCPLALEWIVLAKIISQWLKNFLTLSLALPFLFLLLGVDFNLIWLVLKCLGISLIILTSWGALGAALCLRNPYTLMLTFLILIPFQIPTLIFSLGLFQAPQAISYLYLFALALFTVPLSCVASSALLKSS